MVGPSTWRAIQSTLPSLFKGIPLTLPPPAPSETGGDGPEESAPDGDFGKRAAAPAEAALPAADHRREGEGAHGQPGLPLRLRPLGV